MNDGLGGQYEILSTNASPTVMPHIKSGSLTPLAVGAPKRLDSLPKVPTLAELGYPAANSTSLFGIFAPAGTPKAVLDRLNAEINKALAEPDIQQRLKASDNVPTGGTAAALPSRSLRNRWRTPRSSRLPASRCSKRNGWSFLSEKALPGSAFFMAICRIHRVHARLSGRLPQHGPGRCAGERGRSLQAPVHGGGCRAGLKPPTGSAGFRSWTDCPSMPAPAGAPD
jgi:hypothetical protein